MFAPPGYIMLGALADRLPNEVAEHFFPLGSLQFFEDWNDDDLALSENTDGHTINWMKDWVFRTEAFRNWVIHRVLLSVPFYVCSTSGTILQLGPYVIERMRDDDMATDGEIYCFDPKNSPFERQRSVYLTRTNIYRFFDIESGLIRLGFNDEVDDDDDEFGVSYRSASSRWIESFLG